MNLAGLHDYCMVLLYNTTDNFSVTRKPCYRKDDRAMRPIVDALKNFGSPWLRPRLLFPKLLMTVVVIDRMKVHQIANTPMLGSARAEALSYSALKLFSKNSNLCDHGT